MARNKQPKFYAKKNIKGDDEFIIGGFDMETNGLGGEPLSIQYGSELHDDIIYDCASGMVERFLNYAMQYPRPVIWFAHFAQYDWRYMMDEFVRLDLNVEIAMRNDTDVYEIRIRTEDGVFVMRDSYALWNSKLEKLASAFCPEFPKLEFDFETTKFDPYNTEHTAYAKRDVKILLVGLRRLTTKLFNHYGINPNGTFASTSLKGWQNTLPDDDIHYTSKLDAQELFVRQAYYGGLVFLTDTNQHFDVETFDRNSSYPAAMMKYGVPMGRAGESTDYHTDRMGIYEVTVKAPDDLIIPIIPARSESGGMKWYRGTFKTVCTNRELIFAANHGYEILEVHSGIVYEDVIYPFNDYINKCREIRKEFAVAPGLPLTGEEYLAKFMQNSLYGKFGSRRERMRIIAAHSATIEDLIGCKPYDEEGKWYVKTEIDEEMRCNPHWAVFITAHARLALLQAVYSIGPENVLYGDTDSITCKQGFGHLIDVGDEYGQWKLEKKWSQFRAIAPKVYSGIIKDGKYAGQWKGAAKGLPSKHLNDTHWRQLYQDGKTASQVMSLPSLRVTLKQGVKPATILLRKSSTIDNSSNFEQLPDGKVSLKMAA